MRKVKLFFIRNLFQSITTDKAIELGLKPHMNIYGDLVNKTNCRSIWKDSKENWYWCKYIIDESKIHLSERRIKLKKLK